MEFPNRSERIEAIRQVSSFPMLIVECLTRANEQVVQLLPSLRRVLLKRLCELFSRISMNEDVNLMGVANLSIVFSPTLMRAKVVSWIDRMSIAITRSFYTG